MRDFFAGFWEHVIEAEFCTLSGRAFYILLAMIFLFHNLDWPVATVLVAPTWLGFAIKHMHDNLNEWLA